jgi:hypothetical protein
VVLKFRWIGIIKTEIGYGITYLISLSRRRQWKFLVTKAVDYVKGL